MIDPELGPFLRSRREGLSPTEVGLPVGPRRRTPGLRRAELATIAGISVDYLVRLEQGRDRRPSGQVLAALADALRLDADDRAHLRRIAAVAHGPELCPTAMSAASRQVRPTVRTLLERLEPAPAYVMNRNSDVLAWTDAYQQLAYPLGILDGPVPNLAVYTFCDARAREAFPDWDVVADDQVGLLRASACDPRALQDDEVVSRLTAVGPAFTDRWSGRLSVRRRTGISRIVHPEVGELRVAFETLQLPDADDQHLIVYLPADEATEAALDRMCGRRPGGLRAVGE
jgi:transcriptional regulator with XRE-family HTH domain